MKAQRGFTLVELVVVLTLMAVVASLGATLVGRVVAGQQDNRGRLTVALAADAAVARVADDLQGALPNSLRVSSGGGETWIEWVPVLDAGRYRTAPDTVSGTPGDPLDADNALDGSFDVIGTALATPPSSAQLVFGNLGTPDADAYAGNNRRGGLVVSAGGRSVAFTPAGTIAGLNVNQRVQVVGTPVTLACRRSGSSFELRRYGGYGWKAAQPTTDAALAGATATLVLGPLADCSASYGTALANIGLLTLRLVLTDPDSNARLNFLHQVTVDNTP